jgi:hypothetical protein
VWEEVESGSSPTGHPNRRQALTLIVVAQLPFQGPFAITSGIDLI